MRYNYFVFLVAILLFPSSVAFAQFVPLVGIPGLTDGDITINNYVNALYALSISVAALIAVIQIVIGGAQYMMDDLITHKSAAKERIKNALIGLLIIISAALILSTINSDLTNINLNPPPTNIDNSVATGTIQSICDETTNCSTVVCDGWVWDDMEIYEGESDVDACRRVCEEDYAGEFDANEWSLDSSTCEYDKTAALNCDPQNSWNCCEDIHGYTWYTDHKICSTAEDPVEQIPCTTSFMAGQKICSKEQIECQVNNGELVSTKIKKIAGYSSGSIICRYPTQ